MMEPDPSDVLLTFAEVAVAFAGFASIVAIFQRGQSESYDLFRFWMMLEFSLAALFFALLPFPLLFLSLEPTTVWRVSSAVMVLYIGGHQATVARMRMRGDPVIRSSLTASISALAITAYSIILISQAVNVLGVPFGTGFGLFLLGLFVLLFSAGANFVRLVWVSGARPPRERGE
jgi:hypothetical protein